MTYNVFSGTLNPTQSIQVKASANLPAQMSNILRTALGDERVMICGMLPG